MMRSPALLALVTLLAFSLGMRSVAQPTEVGIKAGPIASTWQSAQGGWHPLVGFTAGIYAPTPVTPRLIVQAEALITAAGATRPDDGRSFATVRTYSLHLPVTLRLRVAERLELAGGLDAGWTANASIADDNGTLPWTDAIRPFTGSMIAGASYRPSRTTDISVRYVYGVTPLLRDDLQYFPTERMLQLTLGTRMLRLKGGNGYRTRNHLRR